MRASMLRSLLVRREAPSAAAWRRMYGSSAPVLEAARGIVLRISLMMKLNPLVSSLSLYDLAGIPGVAADTSHVNTRSQVTGYAGEDGGTEVVEAKAGKGSATLSMAYAGAKFGDACLKGLNGVPDVVKCSFVQSTVTELPFFASKVRLGKNGVKEILGLSTDPNMKDILRKGFSTGNVDLLGKGRKITMISCFGEISGSRGMERNIFYHILESSYSTSNPGWVITCKNDIMLIHVQHGQRSIALV